MLQSGSLDGSQPSGPADSVDLGASSAVAISGPDLLGGGESMVAFADVPLALEASLARLIDRYFGPGATARGMQMVLRHSCVLSISAFREQLGGIEDEKFSLFLRS